MLDCSHSMILYWRGSLHAGQEGRARAHAPDSHAVPRRLLKVVLFHDCAERSAGDAGERRRWDRTTPNTAEGPQARAAAPALAQKKDMRQIIMITDGKPSALTMPNGQIYKNSFGLDTTVIAQTIRKSRAAGGGDHDQHLHARARPDARRIREARVGDQPRQGVLHDDDDAGQFILMDFLKRKTRKVS
jgi:Ca-activated chloride channel family protein